MTYYVVMFDMIMKHSLKYLHGVEVTVATHDKPDNNLSR